VRPAGYRGSDTNPGALQHEGNMGRERLVSSVCSCGAWKGELGLEPRADCLAWARGEPPCAACFVCHLRTIFGGAERPEGLWRVLRDDGTFWLNIGDSMFTHNAKVSKNDNAALNMRAKNLFMVPFRVSLALQADGWNVRGIIAWCKKSAMPESVDDRPTNAWEPVFLLTKSCDVLYWTHRDGKYPGTRKKPKPDYVYVDRIDGHEDVLEPVAWETQLLPGSKTKKRWRRLNLWQANDYFYDSAAIRDPLQSPIHAPGNHDPGKIQGTRDHQGGNSQFRDSQDRSWGNEGGRNMRNVIFAPDGVVLNQWWLLGPEPLRDEHYAAWPTEIAKRAISAGTSEMGVCPQCGAPWERVESSVSASADAARDWNGVPEWQSNRDHRQEPKKLGAVGTPSRSMVGWMPTCGCNAGEPVRATVLDPFAGSGTTLLVADRLGRHGVGIELLPKYVEMIRRRLESDAPLLNMIPEETLDDADEPDGETLADVLIVQPIVEQAVQAGLL
jgi:hypothetical protein